MTRCCCFSTFCLIVNWQLTKAFLRDKVLLFFYFFVCSKKGWQLRIFNEIQHILLPLGILTRTALFISSDLKNTITQKSFYHQPFLFKKVEKQHLVT